MRLCEDVPEVLLSRRFIYLQFDAGNLDSFNPRLRPALFSGAPLAMILRREIAITLYSVMAMQLDEFGSRTNCTHHGHRGQLVGAQIARQSSEPKSIWPSLTGGQGGAVMQ